ncbi:MAG: polymer-forming cytoskeletal protein [Luteolibacter sp.]
MFKKVIGQDLGEGTASAPQPSAATPAASSHSTPAMPPQQPAAAPSASPAAAAAARPTPGGTRNVLSSDVEIKGTVKFTNDLVVDGKIEGEIISQGNLTVGENARIKAEVKTGTVVVYGKVHGNITAADRVELKSSAEVIGDIKTKVISIEAGAIFVGKSTVGAPSEAVAAQPKQATA